MNIASQILRAYEHAEVSEGKVHEHVPEENAGKFSTYGFDPATTEREYIELLHALVRVEKPAFVLETGTGCGIATLVMLAAMGENGALGILTTVDTRYLKSLSLLADKWVPSPRLVLRTVQADSLEWIDKFSKTDAPQFDFCFFDSIQDRKAVEADMLMKAGKIKKGSLLVFHDTSSLRFRRDEPDAYSEEYMLGLDHLRVTYCMQRLEFTNSRGLTILRF